MLVEIGTIVAVYAIARLIQVPLEYVGREKSESGEPSGRRYMLGAISVMAIAIIVLILFQLWNHPPLFPPGMGDRQ